MQAENRPLEKEIPIEQPPFTGSMLNFGGVRVLGNVCEYLYPSLSNK